MPLSEELFDQVKGAASASFDRLEELNDKAADVNDLDRRIETINEQLSKLNRQRTKILTVDMPDLMSQCGMGFGDSIEVGGKKFRLTRWVAATWPKTVEGEQIAKDTLEAYGATDLIKSSLSADFGRGEHETMLQAKKALSEFCDSVSVKEGVHPMTLASFIREKLNNGEDVDLNALNAKSENIVKVTRTRTR